MTSSCLLNKKAQELDSEWGKFKNHIESKLPVCYKRLNPSASKKDIEQLENFIKTSLPNDFKKLYLQNNGEDTSWFVGGVMCGLRMLTIDQIKKEIMKLKAVEAKWNFNSRWTGEIRPGNSIKKGSYYDLWIPIFSDNSGNYIGLDLIPGSAGKSGQIINFGTDEYDHFVIADNLTKFIALINSYFDSGKFEGAVTVNEQGEKLMFGLYNEGHLTDDLREILK